MFLQTLQDAVGGARRLWHVLTADKVSDLLVAGQVGILVLDVAALHEPAQGFLSHIKRQFPDLVVVVAGPREAETSLARLISSGAVYRFIHKPMSPGRAKLFADAAVKKYEEHRLRVAAAPSVSPAAASPRMWFGLGGFALLALVLATWLLERAPKSPQSAGPAGDNVLDLYPLAVADNPADPAARAGLAEVRERSAARAEIALLEERLDEAAAAIDQARKAGLAGDRIALLAARLAKARSQLKAAAAKLHNTKARSDNTAGAADELVRVLELARTRVRENRLVEPDADDAKHYLQEAQTLQPDNPATRSVQQGLAVALLADARVSIERRDFPRAVSLLDAANGIARSSDIDDLVTALRTARKAPQADSLNPPPQSAREQPAPDTVALVNAAVEHEKISPNVVNAGNLTLMKSVSATYPRKAEQAGTEGWVDLEFTVTPAGAVNTLGVVSSQPPGTFDAAAISAVSQWRYKPVVRDSVPVAQRARLRVRFVLRR